MDLFVWQYTPYTIPLFIMAGVAIASALFVLRRRYNVPGVRWGAVLLVASAEWVLGYALELASANLSAKIFWAKVEVAGTVVIPIAFLAFALEYAGRERWLRPRSVALLSIVPLITFALACTNDAHGLVWSRLELDVESFAVLERTDSLGSWLFSLYLSVVLTFAGGLLVQTFHRAHHFFRWQARLLLVAAFFPWVGSALIMLGVNPFPYLNPIPAAVTLTGLAVTWSLDPLRVGDLAPLVRRTIIGSMSDSVVVVDAHDRIVDLNPAAQEMIGHTASRVVGQRIEQLWPEWPALVTPLPGEAEAGGEIALGVGAERCFYDVRVSSLTDWRGRLISRVIVLRDITERKRAEEQLKASLREKEMLLREIHHRVKNNLQVICSLLNLQSGHLDSQQALVMLQNSQHRIRSMALVHEKLQQSWELARVDFGDYVKGLMEYLFYAYGVDPRLVTQEVDVADISLSVDTAIPCGLILNELISNSLAHAFPGERRGCVSVGLHVDEDGRIVLLVGDDGVGFPDDVELWGARTLGLQLVCALVQQIGGTIELDRSRGTAVKITFDESRG
jgi:two-component sensor histidine kinase/PAS domain-containing protein